jgi:uncharacterized protein (DUF433 family)
VPSAENALFTPAEAAVLTRMTVKAVNNAIDKKTVPALDGHRAGQGTRLLDLRALMSLALERRLSNRFVPELRRELFDALAGASRNTVSLDGGFLKIDLREPRRELATSLRDLRRVRRLVSVNPEIMGGSPVFRGTRVPVHMIAIMLEKGDTVEGLLQGYPGLTAEMIRLAPIYAHAYPLQGRPRAQPWHDKPPINTARRKLATLETS